MVKNWEPKGSQSDRENTVVQQGDPLGTKNQLGYILNYVTLFQKSTTQAR